MNAINVTCPACGAPLPWSSGQTFTMCLYCNSCSRIAGTGENGPRAEIRPEIPPEAVDEVKRLLIEGYSPTATAYLVREFGLEADEASRAVKAIKKTTGYKPPLSAGGMIRMGVMGAVSAALVACGCILLARDRAAAGAVLTFIGAAFAVLNAITFRENIRAYLLTRSGLPASAMVLKCWQIASYRMRGAGDVRLLRLLLEVMPLGRAAYRAEANCMAAAERLSLFEPGATVSVKYAAKNPLRVVLIPGARCEAQRAE